MQRLFKNHLGTTPSRWLRQLQCRLAMDLVSRGYSNKAAALELSFATESHFCREFKKAFGVSPQRFSPPKKLNSDIQTLSRQNWRPLKGAARLMREM